VAEKRYQKLIQLYRVIYLLLGATAIGLGANAWIMTKSSSSAFTTLASIIAVSLVTYGFYNRYSVNMFERKITVVYSARNERELVYTLAFGLYGVVILALICASGFIFLKIFSFSTAVTAVIISVEATLFCAIGYIGSIQLRKNVNWLSPN
jgi:hypothetical protein